MGALRRMLRADLEAGAADRAFGTGWFSGVVGLALAVLGLGMVVFLSLPGAFTMPELRAQYDQPWFRLALHVILIAAFAWAVLNLILRRQKIMGFAAVTAVLVATLLGGSRVESSGALSTGYYLGLGYLGSDTRLRCGHT